MHENIRLEEVAVDTPVLHVQGITKSYGNESVLNGIDLSVKRGEVAVIMGPSGSGKSTLLRLIATLESTDSGSLRLNGEMYSTDHRNSRVRPGSIGMVFQNFNLFPHLSAVKNVSLGLRCVKGLKRHEAEELAMEALTRVGLAKRSRAFPRELSGGQQQRVAIARALVLDPELILFDEPTSALDPGLIGDVLDVMEEVASSGMTMVAVTHELRFARSAADVLFMIDGGRVAEFGPPEEVLSQQKTEVTRRLMSHIES